MFFSLSNYLYFFLYLSFFRSMSLTYTDTINFTSIFLVSSIKAEAGVWMMGPEPGRDFGGVLNRLVEHHPVFDAVYTFKILEVSRPPPSCWGGDDVMHTWSSEQLQVQGFGKLSRGVDLALGILCVSANTLGILCVQLSPTVFKWLNTSKYKRKCYGILHV